MQASRTRKPRTRGPRRGVRTNATMRSQTNGNFKVGGQGAAKRDMTIDSFTITEPTSLGFVNSTPGSSPQNFGIVNIAPIVDTTYPAFNNMMRSYRNLYEQYRVRRVRIYASPASNMTYDKCVRTKVLSRIDTSIFQDSASTPNALLRLSACSSTKTNTLQMQANVLIADWNPIASNSELHVGNFFNTNNLPADLQWHSMTDNNQHRWCGATIAVIAPAVSPATENFS